MEGRASDDCCTQYEDASTSLYTSSSSYAPSRSGSTSPWMSLESISGLAYNIAPFIISTNVSIFISLHYVQYIIVRYHNKLRGFLETE